MVQGKSWAFRARKTRVLIRTLSAPYCLCDRRLYLTSLSLSCLGCKMRMVSYLGPHRG